MTRSEKWLVGRSNALVLMIAAAVGVEGCGTKNIGTGSEPSTSEHRAKQTLKPFQSETEFQEYAKRLAPKQQAIYSNPVASSATESASPLSTTAAPGAPAADGRGAPDESITNTQHQNVDEGGIVKLHKNLLVVLRRGRLFTVNIADNALAPISSVDAFGPDVDPGGAWYDELLLSNNTIAVIGYSYARGGTEIGLFNLSETGQISYRATYHLRSNDYYSARNYASRLIGDKLIFYTPYYLSLNTPDVRSNFPALRKWHKGASLADFSSIVTASHIYPTSNDEAPSALHTITTCDLSTPEMTCEANAVLGPWGRVFYVSEKSVYIWATDSRWDQAKNTSRQHSYLYRMPLNGSAPSMVQVKGSPIDQFSFLETPDGFIQVLVRAEGSGDAMWHAESQTGDLALMRLSLESFGGIDAVAGSNYQTLPRPKGNTVQNRFVGNYLLYGAGNSWGYPKPSENNALYAVNYSTGSVAQMAISHGVDRIEPLGANGLVVGSDGKNLHFSPVSLNGQPSIFAGHVKEGASQGELRSHGFFYKPDSKDSGIIGLPVRESSSPGYQHLFRESASVVFLKNSELTLAEIGALKTSTEPGVASPNDGCKASCVDWYGNARPIFAKNRIFALLGYEIVEGELQSGRVVERHRVNFSPVAQSNNRLLHDGTELV